MKLIVGLGNPGKEYKNTRHNVGFQLLDFISKDKGFTFDKEKFNAKFFEYSYNNERVLLIKPLSFMNLSGEVVKKYVSYYKIDLSDVLIIQDDLDMNLGKIKFVFNSSSGGHNGIKDIERYLNTKEYARLKIGISNDKSLDTKDYVLGKFSKDEQKVLNDCYLKLINLIDDFCFYNIDELMSKYNNK